MSFCPLFSCHAEQILDKSVWCLLLASFFSSCTFSPTCGTFSTVTTYWHLHLNFSSSPVCHVTSHPPNCPHCQSVNSPRQQFSIQMTWIRAVSELRNHLEVRIRWKHRLLIWYSKKTRCWCGIYWKSRVMYIVVHTLWHTCGYRNEHLVQTGVCQWDSLIRAGRN